MALPKETGFIRTVDGRASIALCGGWEMSTRCRRGDSVGARHVPKVRFDLRSFDEFECTECDMPLHPIGPSVEDYTLMSIEHHVIKEVPW